MTEAAKEERRAYYRKYNKKRRASDPVYAEEVKENSRRWRKEHPDKNREYQERYWEKLAQKKAAQETAED